MIGMAKKESLTVREIEIMKKVATGSSNQEISEQHQVSIGTVKQHLSNIFKKLKASNRVEAVNKFLGKSDS